MSRDLDELEKLYSPSCWSKRYPSDTILGKYVEFSTNLSNEIKQEIPCELNVPYGDKENQKLDIFGTTLPNDSPIFIFIHGGYWQEEMVHRNMSSLMARSFYKRGCKTIIVGYTLCPQITIKEITDEIRQAIKKCLKYAVEWKTRSISIGGHSAGAHLALSVFPNFFDTLRKEEQDLVKSIFLIGGIYDLTPLIKTSINGPLMLTEESAKALSPMFTNFQSLTSSSIIFFVIVGEHDSPAFVEQSQLFYDHLNKQRINSKFVYLKEFDHFDVIENMDQENNEINNLILRTLC